MHTNISTWTIERIDSLTGELLAYINITKLPTSKTSKLLISNGSLTYGLYKFIFNYTIITNDETVGPYIATTFTYAKIRPTGFIVSGEELDFGEIPGTSYTLSFSDTVAYIPAYFSYDMDALTDQKMLTYNFYCILADINPPTSNSSIEMTNELYSLLPGKSLTPEQMEAKDTCFKDESKLKIKLINQLIKQTNFYLFVILLNASFILF